MSFDSVAGTVVIAAAVALAALLYRANERDHQRLAEKERFVRENGCYRTGYDETREILRCGDGRIYNWHDIPPVGPTPSAR